MTDLTGKHGLIVGVANKRSIAWAIAQAAAAAGARIALTYQGERLEENVRELAASLADPLILPCDVTNDEQIAALLAAGGAVGSVRRDHARGLQAVAGRQRVLPDRARARRAAADGTPRGR